MKQKKREDLAGKERKSEEERGSDEDEFLIEYITPLEKTRVG